MFFSIERNSDFFQIIDSNNFVLFRQSGVVEAGTVVHGSGPNMVIRFTSDSSKTASGVRARVLFGTCME